MGNGEDVSVGGAKGLHLIDDCEKPPEHVPSDTAELDEDYASTPDEGSDVGSTLESPNNAEIPHKSFWETIESALGRIKSYSKSAFEDTMSYIRNNPIRVAIRVAMLGLSIIPGLLAGPLLSAMGFGALGPTAGSLAAGFQSANGATPLFSVLQSAAMGGYGVPIVNTAIQGTVAGVAAISEMAGRKKKD